jgi:hypothetical protein
MLSPREIVYTMRAKHGVATSDDVSRLRDALSRALTSLSDLTGHMDSFLLASQRLTRSGQGETDVTSISSSWATPLCRLVWASPQCRASPLCRLVWPNTTSSIRLYCSRAWPRFSRSWKT